MSRVLAACLCDRSVSSSGASFGRTRPSMTAQSQVHANFATGHRNSAFAVRHSDEQRARVPSTRLIARCRAIGAGVET
jgi:hypothetical protein